MVIVTYVVFIWILYVIIFSSVIYSAKLIYRSTKNIILVISFCVAVFLFSIFDILYGNYVYFKNESSWPDYTVNKSINTVFSFNDLTFINTNDKNFNINAFLSSLSNLYKDNNINLSFEIQKKFKLIEPPKNIKRYVVINGYCVKFGTCEMCSNQTIYDISTGELLGKHREIHLKNVKYLPFFNSLIGGGYWGYSKRSSKAEYKDLRKDVFPNYKFP